MARLGSLLNQDAIDYLKKDGLGELKCGHGLFLFADKSILDMPDNILLPVWKSGRNGEVNGLLD